VFAGRTLLRSLLVGVAAVVVLAPASAALADPTPEEVQKQINDGNNALELVVESYNKVTEDLNATRAALAALEGKMQPLQDQLNAAGSNVDEIAATAYRTGNGGLRTVSLLLSAQSSGTLMDQLATLQQMSHIHLVQIDRFTAAKKSYDAETTRLNELLAAQNAQKNELTTKKSQIEADIARLDAMQRRLNAATGKSTTPAKTNYGPAPAVSGSAGKVVSFAWAQLNDKYVFGAAGPDTWDCSGLTMMAWKQAGVTLPHNAAQQYDKVRHISRSQLAAGDLVFYNGLGHVGIYIGNNQIIHAPNSRTVVKVGPIDGDPIVGYGRPS
jgi:cell wall-associated NlpC family hydrolase